MKRAFIFLTAVSCIVSMCLTAQNSEAARRSFPNISGRWVVKSNNFVVCIYQEQDNRNFFTGVVINDKNAYRHTVSGRFTSSNRGKIVVLRRERNVTKMYFDFTLNNLKTLTIISQGTDGVELPRNYGMGSADIWSRQTTGNDNLKNP